MGSSCHSLAMETIQSQAPNYVTQIIKAYTTIQFSSVQLVSKKERLKCPQYLCFTQSYNKIMTASSYVETFQFSAG